MTTDITYLMILKAQIAENNARIEALTKETLSVLDELRKKCPHPTQKTDRHYSSGGYDYLSSVTVTQTCTICGKVIKSYDDPNHHGTHG